MDAVVNRFKTQLILTDNKTREIMNVHGNKKIYISSSDLEKDLESILLRNLEKGKIGIFTKLSDNKYNVLQQKIINLFGGNNLIKFVRCSYNAMDMISEDETYKQIHNYHRNEKGHTGISENYEGLKRIIYYPNLKTLIQK